MSVDVKEALRLQKENNFVILDVRPEAEFKEVRDLVIMSE
jgi:rhodanese-related sulfurtransferase